MKRRPLRPPYQPWEVQRLLDRGIDFESTRTRVALILIRYAGLREWEVVALRFGDNREPGRLHLPPRRRGVTIPVIDLDPFVQETLTNWHQTIDVYLSPDVVTDETPIMYSRKDGPLGEHALDRCSLSRDMSHTHRQANLRGQFSVEALRRAFGLAAGPDIRRASELLRHDDPSTTCEYLGTHDQHNDVVATVVHLWNAATHHQRQAILENIGIAP